MALLTGCDPRIVAARQTSSGRDVAARGNIKKTETVDIVQQVRFSEDQEREHHR